LARVLFQVPAELDCRPGQPPQIRISAPRELFKPPFGLREKFPASAAGVSAAELAREKPEVVVQVSIG